MDERVQQEIREFYGRRGLGGRVGFGKHPAVLVVDFIVAFTDPECPLAGDLDGPVEATCQILAVARRRASPVIFTTVEYDESMKDAGLFALKVPSLKWLTAGSRWVDLDPRLRRQPGEIIIKKKYASAFFATDLASQLTTQQVDTLILTGCTTSGCIRATAIDALQYGFRAIVPTEAVGDRAQLPHEANLFDIDAKYGDVVSLKGVLSYLEDVGGVT